jgi:sodium-dependent dicarboxylate transporter 2/3/5
MAETGRQISFLRWLAASLPLVLIMLGVALVVLERFFGEEEVDMEAARAVLAEQHAALGPVSTREKGVAVMAVLTIVAWISLHEMVGLATLALVSVGLMFIFRLTRWDVVESNVNWGIILMYGGAIALGSALHTSGASEWLVTNSLGRFHLPGPVVLVLLGFLSLVLTEFISNAAVVSVLMPVGLGFANSHGLSPEAVTLAVALPSGLAYTLPLGTPATALAYSSGYMGMKDFLSVCPLMNLVSFVVFALVALFYWPLLGF